MSQDELGMSSKVQQPQATQECSVPWMASNAREPEPGPSLTPDSSQYKEAKVRATPQNGSQPIRKPDNMPSTINVAQIICRFFPLSSPVEKHGVTPTPQTGDQRHYAKVRATPYNACPPIQGSQSQRHPIHRIPAHTTRDDTEVRNNALNPSCLRTLALRPGCCLSNRETFSISKIYVGTYTRFQPIQGSQSESHPINGSQPIHKSDAMQQPATLIIYLAWFPDHLYRKRSMVSHQPNRPVTGASMPESEPPHTSDASQHKGARVRAIPYNEYRPIHKTDTMLATSRSFNHSVFFSFIFASEKT